MTRSERESVLATWQRDDHALRAFFTEEEVEQLTEARKRLRPGKETIAYCVYENPFAKSGGVFAVAENYCAALSERDKDILALTPYHAALKTAPGEEEVAPAISQEGEPLTCEVPFDGMHIQVALLEHYRRGVRWILLRAEGFFNAEGGPGRTDPYGYEEPAKLLRDSLFACAAIPHALAALGYKDNLIVHPQDWEMASLALTVKEAMVDEILGSAAVVLTSHNPYDRGLRSHALRRITKRSYQGSSPAHTVYQYMIPLTDAPVNTVSENFARELTTDPLQTEYFADHLQDIFQHHGLVGIDDGLFGKSTQPFAEAALKKAGEGDPEAILTDKLAKRKTMLANLSEYTDPRILGDLDGGAGRPLVELPDDVPFFVMFGRMDPGQKGFDVFARAIEATPAGTARFMITPILSGAPAAYLDDLTRLAESRPGEIAVYPFRMEKGYLETLAGATYAVMPSIYEPFGGATEPYLCGTPVVARATGGLVQQVFDADQHPNRATGILFREEMGQTAGLGEQWRAIELAEDPSLRLRVPIYAAMVEALADALSRACDIYRSEPQVYAHMLSRLYDQTQLFSWDRACQEYRELYDLAVR